MEGITAFFGIGNTAFTLLGYPVSWLELLGTSFGLWSVWWTARDRWENWPVGIVNIALFFLLFWQIRLYSDALLQVFFLGISFYGWWDWTHPGKDADAKGMLKVSWNGRRTNLLALAGMAVAIGAWGWVVAHLNAWLPGLFPEPASYPYWDAVPMVLSVVATYWQARKRVESWWLWIAVDVECTVLCLVKGTVLLSIEYFVFGVICVLGMRWWVREWKGYPENAGAVGGGVPAVPVLEEEVA